MHYGSGGGGGDASWLDSEIFFFLIQRPGNNVQAFKWWCCGHINFNYELDRKRMEFHFVVTERFVEDRG